MSKNFLFKNGQTILFVGDSITDCGRRVQSAPLGDGYVKLATDLITARYPSLKLKYINKGISGNTVINLFDRWQDDVLRHRPHWLTIKIGINDLHRIQFGPESEGVTPQHYEATYRSILTRTRKALPKTKIILIDPFYISQDRHTQNRRGVVMSVLPAYLRAVEKMAREFKTLHLRTHRAFQEQLKYRDPDHFCPEPVHPNLSGHMLIAHELLKIIRW